MPPKMLSAAGWVCTFVNLGRLGVNCLLVRLVWLVLICA